jgi:hypothetical protein
VPWGFLARIAQGDFTYKDRIIVKYLLMALLLLPTISFADELHLDLDLLRLYRKSVEKSDDQAEQGREEKQEANQDRLIHELIREMTQPKTKFDDTGN